MVGQLDVTDPTNTTSYIIQSGGTLNGSMTTSGNTLTIPHNLRAYLANQCATDFSEGVFKSYNFLDRSIQFTLDLSQVGCACNAAVYLVSMPGYKSNQQPDPSTCGDYYCDANTVCGVYCPEMDLVECNQYALQVAAHSCDTPQGKFYPDCDGGGCAINTYKVDPNAYGPGTQYTINTLNPFTVKITFRTSSNSQLSSIETVLSQNSKTFNLTHNDTYCKAGYLSSLTDAFKGMVPTFSYWGNTADTMKWLDIPPCLNTTDCDTNTVAKLSNLIVAEAPKNNNASGLIQWWALIIISVGLLLL